MDALVIASTEADARAASAVEQHHAQLAGTLALRAESVRTAAARGDEQGARQAAADLVAWCEQELVPHAVAEESTLYAAARSRPEGRLLVDGMLTEHAVILDLVREVSAATTASTAAAGARALQVVFDNHLAKENTLVLPLLVADPDISVADLLEGMHQLIGGDYHPEGHAEHSGDTSPAGHASGHACACGEEDGAAYPELDARAVPHAIRHATIFGALDGIRVGGGLVLVAPHDPQPLLAQIERRTPGAFSVEYLQRGPDAWRLAFVRQAG